MFHLLRKREISVRSREFCILKQMVKQKRHILYKQSILKKDSKAGKKERVVKNLYATDENTMTMMIMQILFSHQTFYVFS